MYIKLVNGTPEVYSINQLFRDNPNTSFPKVLSEELLAEWYIYPYTIRNQPIYDYLTQTVVTTDIELIDSYWTQGWLIENLPITTAENNIRSSRNNLLLETDWMALSDNIMSPAWATYRQSLRDVTKQPGFPFAVVWPIKPTD
jgi:hypothetical protein